MTDRDSRLGTKGTCYVVICRPSQLQRQRRVVVSPYFEYKAKGEDMCWVVNGDKSSITVLVSQVLNGVHELQGGKGSSGIGLGVAPKSRAGIVFGVVRWTIGKRWL